MAKKPGLPVDVHDHFRKANILHGYTVEHWTKGAETALEAGQELLAAKKSTPPGRWEEECSRLFEPSLRTAQRYMLLAKRMDALPKTTQLAVLFLEGTLDGAAKAAKTATNPKPSPPKRQPDPDEPIDVDSEPVDNEPEEAADRKPKPKLAKKLDKKACYKEWNDKIGPVVRLVDKIARDVGEKDGASHKLIHRQLQACTDELAEWMGVK
jgi:hypothetical protein